MPYTNLAQMRGEIHDGDNDAPVCENIPAQNSPLIQAVFDI